MRMFVMAEPQFPIPPEQFPALAEGFAAWTERYRGQMELFEFFAGGGGGFGVVNVPDEKTLTQMLLEYPFAIYSELDVRPILDGDTALALWRQGMQQLAGTPRAAEGSARRRHRAGRGGAVTPPQGAARPADRPDRKQP